MTIISLHPQIFQTILNLCPICPDIQYTILMLIIGINGTPTSIIIKPKMINIRNMYINKFSYPEQTLSYYMVSLGYWNSSDSENSDDEDFENYEYLSEFLYDISIAYNLYNLDTAKCIHGIQNCLNIQAKKRLNHMIETEPVVI